jgi:tyrosyl-tRNA synthetase
VTVPGDIVAEFASRGLIHDSTNREELSMRSSQSPVTAYVGFDPTADSLHVGHLLGQIALRRLQMLGHRPIVLAGGATGMVGDPSGRSEERNLLNEDLLRSNVEKISRQLERILDFGKTSNAAVLVNNADWTAHYTMLDFLRDVGKHVTVNQMMAKDSVKSRLQDANGLSFTEFSYMLLQANDFRHLCEHFGCEMQLGGSDQWGNITIGADLIRKILGRTVYGLTWPLITKADGTKFGKTASGAVWLDPEKTSPYQFRQFWMQVSDIDIERFLPQFSLRPMNEIVGLLAEQRERPEARIAQRALAQEMTSLVHGVVASAATEQAAEVLFGANPVSASREAIAQVAAEVATTTMGAATLHDSIGVLVTIGLASSNSEARRLLQQRSVRANGEQLDEHARLDRVALLHGRWMLLRKGKSTYHLLDFGA